MNNTDNWILSTDTTADLNDAFVAEYGIDIHPLHYIMNETEYGKDIRDMPIEEFYRLLREGVRPTTSATCPEFDIRLFTRHAREGRAVLHLTFPVAMSASYTNARLAAAQVTEQYPESRITVIDSSTASAGLNVLVRKVAEMKKAGCSFEEAVDYVEKVKSGYRVHFTVPDLFHLMRGGRLKKSAAIVGSVLHIQPELKVCDDGTLGPVCNMRSRKSAIGHLLSEVGECEHFSSVDEITVCHADCVEEAERFAAALRDAYPQLKKVNVEWLSQTLGAHAGPGCLVIGYDAGSR